MPKTRGKSKKELLKEQIAAAVGAGGEVSVESVDFSNSNRPKTCLEVDFPIIPINQIAAIEGNASKPIYQMSKWWARRRSSVFRSMLLAEIEAEVKPQIMPYFACDGPNNEKGKWYRRKETSDTWEELPENFEIFSVPRKERKYYRYEGPEIIYTFWAKHGPCQREGCGHRTPIMSTPVIATKTLTVDVWENHVCSPCEKKFDIERQSARIAPDVPLFVAPQEKPFAVMEERGRFVCPHCRQTVEDERAHAAGNSSHLGKTKSKKIELTLLIHPQWLEGC